MPYRAPQIPDIRHPLKQFREIANDVTHEEVLNFVEEEKREFIRRIKRQDFESFHIHPLSPRWFTKKENANVDTRVMIATGHYIRSIKIFTRQESRKKLLIHVGFNRRTLARNLKGQPIPFPLYKLARVQEHGSEKTKVPPRPHWRPHYRGMAERAVPLRERIRGKIRRETLRRVGPPIRPL